MTEVDEDRRRAAAVLRGLRADAGLSTTQLGGRLGWSQSKVSKTGLGRTTPSRRMWTPGLGLRVRFVGEEHTHQYHGFAVLGDPDADDEALVLTEP